MEVKALAEWRIEYTHNCGYGTGRIMSSTGVNVDDLVKAYEAHWKSRECRITEIQRYDTVLYFFE